MGGAFVVDCYIDALGLRPPDLDKMIDAMVVTGGWFRMVSMEPAAGQRGFSYDRARIRLVLRYLNRST